MVGGVDHGALGLLYLILAVGPVLLDEAAQGGAFRCRDVAGEGLQGLEVSLAAYLYVFRSERIDHHIVGARGHVEGAARARHELGALQVALIGRIEAHLHIVWHHNLRVCLHIDAHVDVEVQVELQVQLQHGAIVLSVVVVVAQVLVFAGGKSEQRGLEHDEQAEAQQVPARPPQPAPLITRMSPHLVHSKFLILNS